MITAAEARRMEKEIKSQEYNYKMAQIEEKIKISIFSGEEKVSVDSLTELQILELRHLGYTVERCYSSEGYEIMW